MRYLVLFMVLLVGCQKKVERDFKKVSVDQFILIEQGKVVSRRMYFYMGSLGDMHFLKEGGDLYEINDTKSQMFGEVNRMPFSENENQWKVFNNFNYMLISGKLNEDKIKTEAVIESLKNQLKQKKSE